MKEFGGSRPEAEGEWADPFGLRTVPLNFGSGVLFGANFGLTREDTEWIGVLLDAGRELDIDGDHAVCRYVFGGWDIDSAVHQSKDFSRVIVGNKLTGRGFLDFQHINCSGEVTGLFSERGASALSQKLAHLFKHQKKRFRIQRNEDCN